MPTASECSRKNSGTESVVLWHLLALWFWVSRIISALPTTQDFNVRSHFWMKWYMCHCLYVVKYYNDDTPAPTYSLNLSNCHTDPAHPRFCDGFQPQGCRLHWIGRSTCQVKWSCSLRFHQFSVTQDGSQRTAANFVLPICTEIEGLPQQCKSGRW